ncbi:MAG: hypothetical protein ACWGMZ_06375 [Thermoguttaceae bacterium]
MPRLLALEWSGSEARLAVASARGDGVLIEQAFSIDLRSRQQGEEKSDPNIGGWLAEALAERGLRRLDALVAIGRTNIELRQLLLPPAPDDELPELVRFQAMQEFNEFDENWLLDFVPLAGSPTEPRTVLAAAIAPELVAHIQKTCRSAGLKPRRLVLRACAAASLLARSQTARQGELRLLVDLLSDEADLTAIIDDRVVFLRTTRLGGEASEEQMLIGQLRRTIAAVQNQLNGQKVDSIVLCGQGEQHAELAQAIEKELAIATEMFDPFRGLDISSELRRSPLEHSGRFAPLLGLLLSELEHIPHAVDFLHPRRRQKPPAKWKRYILPAIAAAALALIFCVYQWNQRTAIQREIQSLNTQSLAWDKTLNKAEKVLKNVDEIKKWTAADLCWLDELDALSKKIPAADEAMIAHLSMIINSQGGQMELEGYAKSDATLASIEGKLRDSRRHLEEKSRAPDASRNPYAKIFKATLYINSAPQPLLKTGK